MRISRAKWCWTHKRPLIVEVREEEGWIFVTCPGHFRVGVPTADNDEAVCRWQVVYKEKAFFYG